MAVRMGLLPALQPLLWRALRLELWFPAQIPTQGKWRCSGPLAPHPIHLTPGPVLLEPFFPIFYPVPLLSWSAYLCLSSSLNFCPRNKVLSVSLLHWLLLRTDSAPDLVALGLGPETSLSWSPLFVVGSFTMSLSLAPSFTHLPMKWGDLQSCLPKHQDPSVRTSLYSQLPGTPLCVCPVFLAFLGTWVLILPA